MRRTKWKLIKQKELYLDLMEMLGNKLIYDIFNNLNKIVLR